jgi:hypothetical protein
VANHMRSLDHFSLSREGVTKTLRVDLSSAYMAMGLARENDDRG